VALERVRRNLSKLKRAPAANVYFFRVWTPFDRPAVRVIVASDLDEAYSILAKREAMTEAEVRAFVEKVFSFQEGRWVEITPAEREGLAWL